MGNDTDIFHWWKWVALVAIVGCILLATALVYVCRYLPGVGKNKDERLLGVWQSDADRTVAEWYDRRPISDETAQKLRQEVFGQLRLTYTQSDQILEFAGEVRQSPFVCIARDATSVVIQVRNADSGVDELTHIHFVHEDLFWIHIELAPMREYYRRVK